MDLRARLDALRSFIWWTVPLYVLFLVAGVYLERFALTMTLDLLLGVLAAFGSLDAVVLLRLQEISGGPLDTVDDLLRARSRIERLARWLVVAGGAFGAAFVIGTIALEVL